MMEREAQEEEELPVVCPRLADWIWHPWYAKLWWGSAALFWTLAAVDSFAVRLVVIDQDSQNLVYLPLLLLHPFLIVPVLAFGFVRAWLNSIEQQSPAEEQPNRFYGQDDSIDIFPKYLDPTNSLDPRFIMHPANPMSPASRKRRLWNHR